MPGKSVGGKRARGPAADHGVRPTTDETEGLARELFEARCELRNAGRALHDHAGSLLSTAGIRLQLLRMDLPDARTAVDEVLLSLDEAMDRVRVLSHALNPSPAAHLGLRGAMAQLVARRSALFPGGVRLAYSASAQPPPHAAVAIYDAVTAMLDYVAEDRSATSVKVRVSGTRNIAVRMFSNGRGKWSRSAAAAEARRARPAGVTLDTTEKGTLVCIKYAPRRAPRG